MRVKKILVILLVSLLLTAGIAFFYYYRKFTRPSELPASIPSTAESVVYINFKSVYKRFLQDKDSSLGLKKFRNPYLASIKDPRETGIDFLSDAAVVRFQGITYAIVALDNEEKLRATIEAMPEELFSPIEKHEGFHTVFSKKDLFILAWNHDLLVAIPTHAVQTRDPFIKSVLEVGKDQSFARHPAFEQVKKEDALAWFYTGRADIKISPPSALKGYLSWDSSIHVFATDHISGPYPPVTAPATTLAMNQLYSDSGKLFIDQTLEALALVYLPSEIEKIRSAGLRHSAKTFKLGEKKEISSTSITYEFDENFTKKKIVTVNKDTIHTAQLSIHDTHTGKWRIFTNDPDSATGSYPDLPPYVSLAARFNQDLLNTLYPLPFTYQVQFIQTYNKGYNTYLLTIQPGKLDQLPGWPF